MPSIELSIGDAFDDDAQPFLAERFAVVGQVECRGIDDEQPVTMRYGEFWIGSKVAIDGHLRQPILKLA